MILRGDIGEYDTLHYESVRPDILMKNNFSVSSEEV